MDEFCEEQQHPLLALPEFLFEKIVLYLHIRDVLQLGLVCRALHERTNNEHLWQDFCQKHWGNCTQVERWLRVPDDGNYVAVDPPSGSAFRGFRSYKSLFKFLSSMEALLGVWRSESTSRGCLYVFSWQSDCISGREVSYDSMVKLPLSAPFVQIGPSSRANAQLIGNACILKKISFPSKASSSAAAEAVAAVAIGPYRSDSPNQARLGSSPEGSFEFELFRFMQGNVAAGRNTKKYKSRSPGQAPGSPLQTTYRLIRVDRAVPSKRHSLSGLWKGKYGGETPIQVIHITYDFTGPCAKIHALKVDFPSLFPPRYVIPTRLCLLETC
eukprot:jgi/Botrbrau1/13221/Bobra.9_1s0010.2